MALLEQEPLLAICLDCYFVSAPETTICVFCGSTHLETAAEDDEMYL
jgi:ribosomal protein L40E